MDALAPPPAAVRDADALELARVWIAEQGLHCALRVGLYAGDGVSRETMAWGVILADMAGHVADALSAGGLGAKEDLLGRWSKASTTRSRRLRRNGGARRGRP